MPLDPRAQRLLHMLSAAAENAHDKGGDETAEDRRRDLDNLTLTVGGEAPELALVEDLHLPREGRPIPLRRYRPADCGPGAMVFFHGGGWVAGSLATHDGVCRRLALASARQVFAVDYRLAPEHPFPAALSDALAAVQWIAEQAETLGFDRQKLVVAGDSAGGNLAAACLLMRGRTLPPVAGLLLICPILDLAEQSASRRAFKEGYFLSQATMKRDLADYVRGGEDLRDPRLSPLYAADLSNLPPTHIHTAEFDPFRDEGLAFAARLKAAGVEARSVLHPGMIHYFYAMPGAVPYAEAALRAIGETLREGLED